MSFSCPDASLGEMLSLAQEFGYDGVEPRTGRIHAHGIELDTGTDDRKRILDSARAHGVTFSCLAIGSRFANPAVAETGLAEAQAGIRLARDLESGFVRVFGGQMAVGDKREDAIRRIARSLQTLAPLARDCGVTVCFETHDDWCDPAHVAAVMEEVDDPAIGVNWDVMHPVRTRLTTMEESYRILRPWIRHVHIHDGTCNLDALEFKAFGEGEYDLDTVFRALLKDRYDGTLSGEWINWEPARDHLPREIERMRALEADLRKVAL